jgi:hypothetical protein
MTKKQRRDKESSAQSHRKKINERPLSDFGLWCVFSIAECGIVNLARRRTCRKVATKARIVVGSLPVARKALLTGPGF